MNKQDLMSSIAEKGYDVGFGAKKHFATYEIIEKAPGWISFSALAFGIFALAISGLSTKLTSSLFIVLGVVGLYIRLYEHKKNDYEASGVTLTRLYNELKALYYSVKSLDESEELSIYHQNLLDIEKRYYPACISKQILFSNWFAHYKFFWENQIGWVDEQLRFKLFRDKIPLTLSLLTVLIVLGIGFWLLDLMPLICKL
jgi:uncharacterized membrane protein